MADQLDQPFHHDGLGYVFEPPTLGIRFRVDYLKRHGEEMHGILTVDSTRPGGKTHIHEATHNFGSLTARVSLSKALGERMSDVPWRDLLETFCVSVMRSEREGAPFLDLSEQKESVRELDQIERIVPWRAPTWLYGEEGSCKGLIATALTVCVATGHEFLGLRVRPARVAYLDWEDDHDEMTQRIGMVCRGFGIPVPKFYWRSCRRNGSLRTQVHQIAKEFAGLGIGFYVVDSVGLAAGLGSERGGPEETSLALFEAMGSLDATPLCIDHVNKSDAANKGAPAKAYGSMYKMALCRHAWELRKDQEDGSAQAHIGLFNRKTNRGTKQQPIGLRIDWSEDGRTVHLVREDVRESAELAQTISLRQRMVHLLGLSGPVIPDEIAEQLGVTLERVRTELSPSRNHGAFLRFHDDPQFWVLAAGGPIS